MEGTRAFVFMAIVAAVLAVEIGPLLPTPLPSSANLTTDAESENKTAETTTSQTISIPILSVLQNDTSPKDSKKGRAMNDTALDINSSINSIHSNSTQNGGDPNKMDTKKLVPDLSDVSMDNDDMDIDLASKNSKESPKKVEDDIKANLASIGETRILNKPSIMAEDRQFGPLLVPAMASAKDVIETTCFDAGKMYKVGDHIERGCDEMCTCEAGGRLSCSPRCSGPFLKRGSHLRGRDPLCNEKRVDDPCCSILVCAADAESGMCVSGNKTYSIGENFNEGCKRTCTCEEGGNVTCLPRCPVLEQRDDCVDVPDPKDSCCMLQLCDVSQDVDEETAVRDAKAAVDRTSMLTNQTLTDKKNKTESAQTNSSESSNNIDQFPRITEIASVKPFIPISESMLDKTEPILSVSALPNGTIQVHLRNDNSSENRVHLELSKDGGLMWKEVQLNGGMITGLEDGTDYIVRSRETGMRFSVNLPKIKDDNDISKKGSSAGCMHRGVHRGVDEEFHMGCDELCVCLSDGNVECAPLVCPSSVGLDALDSTCVQWAPDPPDFKPIPPACCPPAMTCVSNGSCSYKGHDIPNWSEVPLDLSGCEQRCFCESGSVECQAVCAPLTALPPQSLRCVPPMRPAPRHPDGDKCCKEWACVLNGVGGLPNVPSGPGPLGAAGASGEGALQVVVLEASSPTTLRLVFSLPSVMVGLQGRVQLRYTDSSDPDPSSWRLQEFAPPEDLLATPQLEFQLGSLQPDTLYKIQAAVVLRQLPYVPKSHIYTVKTLPLQEETTLPPVIPIEPNLAVGQVNPSTAQINWRSFTQDELLYIDGIQLRYREIDGKVFSGTPLIHRAVTTFQLEGLKPNTSYEVGIYFIPFLGQHTELQSANMARLITPPVADMYDWNVLLDVSDVTAWGLTLQWSGVPRPAERYVHVCRAVWRAEAARADKSSFSLPTRDAPPMANITGLTPGTRYRIWLELYLTNGKIKTSNVKDVMTKPGKPAPQEASTQEGKQLDGSPVHKGDYYSSLVAVGVLAALGAMTSLVLLLVLVRRHRTASAPICASAATPHNNAGHRNNGATLPPYDSPSYKIDLQQETMDL